jgi:hypothetical protein
MSEKVIPKLLGTETSNLKRIVDEDGVDNPIGERSVIPKPGKQNRRG